MNAPQWNSARLLGIVLITGGALALAYGSFTYTRERHDLDLGVVDLTWRNRETVHIPLWAGIAGIAAGALLLLFRKPA